jgi:uncharacterized damage-inducible protein DinB
MVKATRWFERSFPSGLPAGLFPGLVERLRGTPARLEEAARELSVSVLTEKPEGCWSIQEHVGHLGDLEELWSGRLDDFAAGNATLRPADLENRRTHQADHNRAEIDDLLASFRRQRQAIVARLHNLGDSGVAATARHPRLDQPMSLIDMLYFLAEHDDHHLARIAELKRGLSG